ncbi:type VII secretion target [Gordonia sp. VNK21]|uniref:type VII secretion target n=1 Tax=Gordonia sp. VNK21 TaxID=3382483 RepID=UPI0038D3A86E
MNDETTTTIGGSALTVSPDTLTGIAGAQSGAAGAVAAQAAAERFDSAQLVPTFGLIGAPFLGALTAAMNGRARQLDAASAVHVEHADRTAVAALAYDGADTANGGEVTV